ncbi:XdhC family protein [Dictyobacter arantiisoli]|uniref:Xanthine dehydrogenase accessory factor n=1 Tax=Dictyobacter arantiisoli TaxID=2014874 RepID=A0A5A5T5B7_9CHLR|nr:XdhC/CoxI family protein [Dictyobacter arantiisoli]GCF06512.1 xanthine dehydrogenase accessory factor [Dictyobacter arantiisoli]
MSTITIYSEIQSALSRGEKVVVATVTKTMGAAPCPIGSKALIYPDGKLSGGFAGPYTDEKVVQAALKILQTGHAATAHIHLDPDQGEAVGSCGATLEIFYEILRPEPRLIIIGAGYVAQALTRIMTHLDFRMIVVDDRRDLANPQSFDSQVQITFGDIPQTIHELAPDEVSWIIIATRGHNLDKEALRATLDTSATYIGMIGSPGKVKRIFQELHAEGIPHERLAQIHAPIGLDLGAETPDAIALSIAAEVVMLRNNASGISLKNKHHILESDQNKTMAPTEKVGSLPETADVPQARS